MSHPWLRLALSLGWIASLLLVATVVGAERKEVEDEDVTGDDSRSGGVVRLASLDLNQQPPAVDPTSPTPNRSSRASRSTTYARLSRAPNMFGDSQLLIRTFQVDGSNGTQPVLASFAANAVGARKIAENEKVLPMDRVFASYNEFHGVSAPLGPPNSPPSGGAQFGRSTLGFEKTFLDGTWSAEARIAASSSPEMSLNGVQYDGGTPANLTFYLKNLLYGDDEVALGAGLGLGVPMSSDVVLTTPNNVLVYREETLHLMPYVGFLAMPTDEWFFGGFAQLDFSTGQNQLSALRPGGAGQALASAEDQHLLFLDLSIGRWLYRDEGARVLTGLAAVTELHYITTLNDADSATALGPAGPLGPTGLYTLSSAANRIDVLNLTAGVQFQLGAMSNLRVAGVAPLTNDFNRLFDSEIQISFNRMF